MKNYIFIFIIFFIYFSPNQIKAQINPISIIDKISETLLPGIVTGIKEIQEVRNSKKNELAKKVEEDFKTQLANAVTEAKKFTADELGRDIEYLETMGAIQNKVQRINNDVGRISMFKDVNFLDQLINQEAVVVKNEIVRKFQNALEQINENKSDLRKLQNNINTTNVQVAINAAMSIEPIIYKLEEINSSLNDSPSIEINDRKEEKINARLRAIKSVATDIGELETFVSNLNTATSAMLTSYVGHFKEIKKQ